MNLKSNYAVMGCGTPISDLAKAVSLAVALAKESGLVKKIVNFNRVDVGYVANHGQLLIICELASPKDVRKLYKEAAKHNMSIQRFE